MSNFINLEKNIKGTYKFKAEWEIIDHFIISNNLIKEELISNNESIKEYKWIYTYLDEVDIFSNKFLLIPCNKYNGFKINRTMLGPRYLGGVSDHLPIILKIYNERL